jgi:hypothetical protein
LLLLEKTPEIIMRRGLRVVNFNLVRVDAGVPQGAKKSRRAPAFSCYGSDLT